MPKTARNNAVAEITAIGEKMAEKMGMELLEAAFEKEPTGLYLRFYVEKEGGVSLDDCEAYHRAVQPLVEKYEYDFMEVCSPGIDRPIKTERDAARCLGLDIEVRLFRPKDGQKVFTGQFTAYDSGDITILSGGQSMTFLKKEVALARCVIDMDEVENVDLGPDEEPLDPADEGKDE